VIWIILAALGIPIWLVLGGLVATLLSRRSFKRRPGVFPVKLRVVTGEAAKLKASWPRRPGYARWVHDVLLVQHGGALRQTEALAVARMMGPISPADPDDIRALGDAPLVMSLELDGGATIELAAPADARATMVGPFDETPEPHDTSAPG
jgi:hypothetical protein